MTDANIDDDIKKLLVENLADTKILKEEICRIKSYMRWRTIVSLIWIALIVLPAILALFYVPDFIKGFATSASLIKSLGL
ncbi:MAG: hypothetical protein WC517_00245 [Patescibacteria group bacterium]